MRTFFFWPIAIVSVANIGVLLAGALVAVKLNSEHALVRAGSAMVAVTGLFVIWQVIDELLMERALRRSVDGAQGDLVSPIDRLAAMIERRRSRRSKARLHEARLTLVILIAVWLSLGEAMHGFGDMAFEAGVAVKQAMFPAVADSDSPVKNATTGEKRERATRG